MPTEPHWNPRFEVRGRAYRRLLHRASLVSAALHLAATICIFPEPLLRLLAPDVPLGYPGRPQRGALGPPGPKSRSPFSLVFGRGYRTPVSLIRPVVLGKPGGTAPSTPGSTSAAGRPVPGPSVRGDDRLRPMAGVPGDSVRIELDESWANVPGSGQAAHSERFQILSLKRPDYPRIALRQGIQGLVRLEVRVDVEGKVARVRVIDSPSGSDALVDAAVEAIYQWRFRPYETSGGVIPFTVLVPFRFRLIG